MSIPYIPVKLVEIIIQFAVEDNPRETHFTRIGRASCRERVS